MATTTEGKGDLAQRIKAEFDGRESRRQSALNEQTKAAQDREKRLEQFTRICEELKSVWRPRLDEFARQFGEKVKMSPTVMSEQRKANISFVSDLATMTLTLSASASIDVTKLVLESDLLVIPMFFDYDRHGRLEMSLDKIDQAAIGKWIDDRLISCVKTYFAVMDNAFYVNRAMVEDPITKTKLLREDAKGQLEHAGRTYYFSSEDSLRKFREKHAAPQTSENPKAQTASKAPAAPTADAPARASTSSNPSARR